MTAVGVKFSGVSIGYRADQPVAAPFDLEVRRGEVLAVVGPNGSGKTTLFRTVLGILPPLSGTVEIAGQAPFDYRSGHGIGFLPEDSAFPGGWSAGGILELARSASSDPSRSVEECCRLGGVDFDLGLPAAELSKGMRRRLANAAALVSSPHLVLLDEPEAGLDPAQRVGLRARIREISHEATVLVSTHDLREATEVCDRALLLMGDGVQCVEPEPGAFAIDPVQLERLFIPPAEGDQQA